MAQRPTWRPAKCRDCGQVRDVEHPISTRGLCKPCGDERQEAQARRARRPICNSPEEQARRWAKGLIRRGQELLDQLDNTG